MILTLDTDKFRETGLRLYDYAMLLLYAQRDYYTAKELALALNVTERTALEKRSWLTEFGWLTQHGSRFYLSTSSKQAIAA